MDTENMLSQENIDQSVSMINMLLKADIVIILVVGLLIISSVVSWAIIFERTFALNALKRNLISFENLFWSGVALETIQDKLANYPNSPIERIFIRAMNERDRCVRDGLTFDFAQSRLNHIVELSIQKETDELEGNSSFLATVGSVAPFVGLFGTVWGIMNSFTAIANTNNTSLSVVAPGIAEALLVTAIGLAAAIPAVIAYNQINKKIDHYHAKIGTFSDELIAILTKHLYQNMK